MNKSWIPLIIIAFASFVIALDATFMNVAISTLVVDLNTTLPIIQSIITFYTLITASLMLIGAKLQDILGKKKIFLIGAFIYGCGTLIATISPNSLTLFIGWSLLEGIGGALMTPATLSIISGMYDGEKRTLALAIISGMAGIGAAIGPIFGGILTTYASWRYGFAIELLVIIFIFIFSKEIKTFKPTLEKSSFDIFGAILSVAGLILVIMAVLSLSSFNLTNTLILLIAGIIFLILFGIYEIRRDKSGKEPLLKMSMLKTINLSVGTVIRLLSALVLAGLLISISIYLELVLKTNAFMTGLALMPLTIALLIFALFAPKLAIKLKSRKKVMMIGLVIAIIGTFILKYQFGLYTQIEDLILGMFVIGGGLGLVISLGVDVALIGTNKENEASASGFISTGNSLGSSMGTAIIGVLLIVGAIGGLHQGIDMYVDNSISDDQFNSNLHSYIEKMGHLDLDELKIENSTISLIVNNVLFEAMKTGINAITIILVLCLACTPFLKEEKY